MTQDERDRVRRQNFLAAMAKAEEREEVVEETVSNDEWYQSELFESLKKRWTK